MHKGERESGRTPRDRHPWRAAVWLGLAVIAGGMAWSMLGWPLIQHARQGAWLPPPDVWHPMVAARQIVHGSWGHIYGPDPFYVAGPLFALFLAPVEALSRGLGLSESHLFVVARPTAWLLYGPYGLAAAIPLLYAVRALATQAGLRSGRLALQVVAAVLVMLPVGVAYGHYEDAIALALVMLAAHALLRGRPVLGAVVLGLAIATKQWAVLAVPLYAVATPTGKRVRVVVAAAAVSGAAFAIPLAADWAHASRALFAAPTFPRNGAAALWVSSGTGSIVGTPARLGAVAVALGIAWRLAGRASEPGALLGGLGLTFLARFLFEPVVYSYYLAPGLAFLLLHERIRTDRVLRTAILGGGWLLWFQVWPAGWWWWALTFALAAAASGRALRDLVDGPRAPLVLEPVA